MASITDQIFSKLKTIKDHPMPEQWLEIKKIYTYSPPDQWDQELIAKVPEFIATYGDVGLKWLNENAHDLLDYYLNVINPKIKEYIDLKMRERQ